MQRDKAAPLAAFPLSLQGREGSGIMANRPFNYKAENLDEKEINKIFTKRRCDYIRRPPKISVEVDGKMVCFRHSSIKEWESFKERQNSSGKARPKGRFDYAIRHLKALANDKNLPEDYRQKYAADHRTIESLRTEESAWGAQKKRIAALEKTGKIIKKIEQARNEIVCDLVKYIDGKRKDNITLDIKFSLAARVMKNKTGEVITKDKVRTIYYNTL